MENTKVALIHDWLTGQRGGEKVLEVFSEIFPSAPIYTLVHSPKSQIPALEAKEINTSFIQKLPLVKKKYRSYLPLFPLAVELFDLQEFDLLISSSHCVAKGIIPHPGALHISYIHSPMRYAWNQYFSYFAPHKLGVFSRYLIPPALHRLRLWDAVSTDRVDFMVANSRTVADRIHRYYRRTADVIHPPVDTEFFQIGEREEDYFLIVSALVPYKKIELAIHAFNRSDRQLRIVGQGPDYKKLSRIAGKNVRFLGNLEPSELLLTYQAARALIMPGEEDFGINSLESQACGVPVIAYGRGGATETVIPHQTGLFFPELTVAALLTALDKFQSIAFNKNSIRENALNYSREKFKSRVEEYFRARWKEHKQRND